MRFEGSISQTRNVPRWIKLIHPTTRFFQIIQYFNSGLSLMGGLTYYLSCAILASPFKPLYMAFCVCCIQVAYGMDNLSDLKKDKFTWKGQVIPISEVIFAKYYKLYLLGVMLLGLVMAVPFLPTILTVAIPAFLVLLHSFTFSLGNYSLNIKSIPYVKPLLITSAWLFLLVGVPGLMNPLRDTMSLLIWTVFLAPSFLIAIIISDYRDVVRDKQNKRKYISTTVPFEIFKLTSTLSLGVHGLFFFYLMQLNKGIQITPHFVIIWACSIGSTLFIWPYFKKDVWGDLLSDSLGGIPLLMAYSFAFYS